MTSERTVKSKYDETCAQLKRKISIKIKIVINLNEKKWIMKGIMGVFKNPEVISYCKLNEKKLIFLWGSGTKREKDEVAVLCRTKSSKYGWFYYEEV